MTKVGSSGMEHGSQDTRNCAVYYYNHAHKVKKGRKQKCRRKAPSPQTQKYRYFTKQQENIRIDEVLLSVVTSSKACPYGLSLFP